MTNNTRRGKAVVVTTNDRPAEPKRPTLEFMGVCAGTGQPVYWVKS